MSIDAPKRPAPARPAPDPRAGRLPHVDALRGLAALTIAVHHICSYGALPDLADDALPLVIDWAWLHGRLAVQVFLVISGLVTALALGRAPVEPAGLPRFAARRYVRLAIPYLAAIAYLLALAALIPARAAAFPLTDPPDAATLLAHAAFLQDVLGFGGLSAGFWYLAIDFQFGLFFYLLMIVHRALLRRLPGDPARLDGPLLLAVAAPPALASAYAWNRDPALDVWVVYHLGPLLLGAACGWALAGRITSAQLLAFAALLAAGLAVEWRIRLAVALAAAALVYGLTRARTAAATRSPLLALGAISYSLFLFHYPTTWAVESLGRRFWESSPAAALEGMAASLAASLVVAAVMHRLVERPSLRLADRLR